MVKCDDFVNDMVDITKIEYQARFRLEKASSWWFDSFVLCHKAQCGSRKSSLVHPIRRTARSRHRPRVLLRTSASVTGAFHMSSRVQRRHVREGARWHGLLRLTVVPGARQKPVDSSAGPVLRRSPEGGAFSTLGGVPEPPPARSETLRLRADVSTVALRDLGWREDRQGLRHRFSHFQKILNWMSDTAERGHMKRTQLMLRVNDGTDNPNVNSILHVRIATGLPSRLVPFLTSARARQ
jgi:hypothetical protein